MQQQSCYTIITMVNEGISTTVYQNIRYKAIGSDHENKGTAKMPTRPAS